MVKKRAGAGKGGPENLKIGLLLLPPGGWKAEPWLGRAVAEAWPSAGASSIQGISLKADPVKLGRAIRSWADRERFHVVCVVGRCGHGPDDFTPDVTRRLLHRSLPGIEERMYLGPPRRPEDLLFRGAAGIRGETMIINLPDRPERIRAALRFMAPVLRHALEKIAGDESECGQLQRGVR